MRHYPTLLRGWLGSALLVASAFTAAAPLTAMAQASPAAQPTQTSTERGVTIKVTPKPIGAGKQRWEFSIVLDTHSAELSDDLLQSSTLATGDGRSFRPVSWTGAAPGGHHRAGVLVFEVSAPPPATLELRIVRAGESAPRTFRWQR